MTARRRNTLDLLRGLPEVFDLSTFVRMAGVERDVARTYLTRWAKAGLVRHAGPRAGIYYNVARAPDAASRRATDALRMAYPSAVLRGASALHAAGWTTQIPARLTVAVMERPSYAQLDGFDLSGRPRDWYAAVHADLVGPKDFSTYGLRSLSPAMALADCLADPASWRPDPDDLDVEDAEWERVRACLAALGAPEPGWLADMPGGAPAP